MKRISNRIRFPAPPDRSAVALDWTAEDAASWIFSDVLPLWAIKGHDQVHGGFFEQIALDGEAIMIPKRCRVQARQTYAFIEAGRIGWNGPWKMLAESGLEFMLTNSCSSGRIYAFQNIRGRLTLRRQHRQLRSGLRNICARSCLFRNFERTLPTNGPRHTRRSSPRTNASARRISGSDLRAHPLAFQSAYAPFRGGARLARCCAFNRMARAR